MGRRGAQPPRWPRRCLAPPDPSTLVRSRRPGASADRAPQTGPPPTHRARRGSRWLIEWAVVLVVAIVVAVGIRTFVVQTFYIPSASMEPTLMIGDRILVDKLSYHLHAVHRGDIVVFATPPGEDAGPDVKDLVKRVIGLPGETISSAGGQVVINGKPLKEPWLVPGHRDHGDHDPEDPRRRVLRDGGQPVRLPGQPVLRPHPQLAHRGPRGGQDLAPHLVPLLLIPPRRIAPGPAADRPGAPAAGCRRGPAS